MVRKSAEAAHRRAMSVWHVVIPAAAVVLAALVGIVPPLLRKDRPPPRGDIVTPAPSAHVGSTFQVRGTAADVPEDHTLWIAVQVDNLFWPKLPVPDTRGTFLVTVSEGGEPGRPFAVVLLLASRRGVGAIERWLAEGQRTGNFPGLPTIPGTSVLDVHPLIHD